MVRSSRFVIALAVTAALTSACGGGDSKVSEGAPSAFAGGSSGETGTVVAPGSSGAGATPAKPDGAQPASGGDGKCLDLASPVVRNAVAGLPAFRGIGYAATRGTDAKAGACPSLMWAHADLQGGTGSSPEWILFFDRQGYLGTATSRYTSFTSVTGSTDDTVAVTYRWLNPGDVTAGPSGGPVVVTYRLSGRTATPDRYVPHEVFDGGASTTTATTTTATTTSAAPVSHCSEATPALLKGVAEMNWGAQIAKPYTVDNVVCADGWASARIPLRPEYQQNTKLLFHYTGGGWSGVAFGSGFTCVDKGVPVATAAKLGC